MSTATKHHGKFKATVKTNVDPLKRGRIKVVVPDISGDELSGWADPCMPVAGPQSGAFFLPPVDSNVWVEFQQGDPDHPIWIGGYWSSENDLPSSANKGDPKKPNIVLQSCGGHQFLISDVSGDDGGILLKASGGANIRVSDNGIVIDNGKGAKISITDSGISIDNGQGAKVELQGNSANINGGALTIM